MGMSPVGTPCAPVGRRGGRAIGRSPPVWAIPNRNPFGGHATGADADTGHATQKPVALFETPIRNHTEHGEAIYGMRPPVGQRLTGIGRRAARGWIISGVL